MTPDACPGVTSPLRGGQTLFPAWRLHKDATGYQKNKTAALTFWARNDRRRGTTFQMRGFQLHLAKPVQPSELVTVVASLVAWRK